MLRVEQVRSLAEADDTSTRLPDLFGQASEGVAVRRQGLAFGGTAGVLGTLNARLSAVVIASALTLAEFILARGTDGAAAPYQG